MPRSAQQSSSVLALETPGPLTSRRAVGLDRVKEARSPAGRPGQGEEVVRGQLAVVGEELQHGGAGARCLLVEQLLGDGHGGAGIEVEGRVGRLVVDTGGQFDRERGAGRGRAQGVHDAEGGLPLQGADLQQSAAVVQVGDGGAVGADRQAVAVDVVADDIHPAGGAAGDEEDLDPGFLGGGERRDRTVRDGLVVPQEGAVQIGGDQPGSGRKRGIGS